MPRKVRLVISACVALVFAGGLGAQTPKRTGATLTGTVLGADGKPIANAAVSCESSGGLSPHATHTDAKGKFVITGLKQDSYDLRAAANGVNSDWHRNIPVRKGQTKDVTLRLLAGPPAPGAVSVLPQNPPPRP